MTSIPNAQTAFPIDKDTATPGEYGRKAYRKFHETEQDTLKRLNAQGDFQAAVQLISSPVRYTPLNTVKNGYLTDEGKENLLGFADEFIQAHDKNKDGVLDHRDFYERLESKEKKRLDRIDYELAHPAIPEEEREQLQEERKHRLNFIREASEELVKMLDLPNAQGETDGLVSRDEAAAHFLTQDDTLGSIKRNMDDIKAEFQATRPNDSWDWFQFKVGVGIALAQIIGKLKGGETPFKMDGRISGAERFVSGIWSMVLPESSRAAIIRNYREHDLEHYKPKVTNAKD
ncbi:MAG TPA: hypothetical protein V6C99_07280 [Oculatellaceae cyanobacterium]|jgi:hypothetical protein